MDRKKPKIEFQSIIPSTWITKKNVLGLSTVKNNKVVWIVIKYYTSKYTSWKLNPQ